MESLRTLENHKMIKLIWPRISRIDQINSIKFRYLCHFLTSHWITIEVIFNFFWRQNSSLAKLTKSVFSSDLHWIECVTFWPELLANMYRVWFSIYSIMPEWSGAYTDDDEFVKFEYRRSDRVRVQKILIMK